MLQNELSKKDREEFQKYIKFISIYQKLTLSELEELLVCLTKENKQKFIYGYLIRVANYAVSLYEKLKQYFDFPYGIMDFIQEGNEVLTKLVYEGKSRNINEFNLTFYTYFKRNIAKNLLPISHSILYRYINFIEQKDNYSCRVGYEVSAEEFGLVCGLSLEQVKFLKVCFIQNQPLNYLLDENKILDNRNSVEEIVSYLITHDMILETFEEIGLTVREREIIIKHFGFNAFGYNGLNLETKVVDLAKECGISHQRIFQILNQSIKRFNKNHNVMKKLRLCKDNVI